MKGTPFRTAGRVSGEDFYGRSEIIRATVRSLRSKSNVAIVGPPRIGRSSLLSLLFQNYKLAERDVMTWFTDLRKVEGLEDLVEEFYIGMGVKSKDHSLNALVQVLKGFQKRIIYFIDSAERFATPPFNEEALFAILASYLQKQHITLCIASTIPPQQMLTNRIGFPLHSLFVTNELGPLSPDECEDLIQKKLEWTGIHFTPAEVEDLIVETRCHPGDLQLAAGRLFKEKMTAAESGKPQSFRI